MTIRVAFPLIGRGTWTGGVNYLKNTLRLIQSRLNDEIEASVFLSPAENDKFGGDLAALVNGRLLVDPAISQAGRGSSLAGALVRGSDRSLARVLGAAGIDVAFEVANFYGARFPIPIVAWVADLQHRHMPELFGTANWWRRDIGFRAQVACNRTLMLSSMAARDDLERFYPAARGRGHVVRFAIDMDIAASLDRDAEMRATYDLPERYLFLPNQFWSHKNHRVVVAALARLKAEGALDRVPPVILSGLPKDPRNPHHFEQLIADAESAGLGRHFRYLGLIPYADVLSLNAMCHAMINPSLFEGWSTPIEEAKAFATPLMLSDIAIHREQAPGARFFDPLSAIAAAAAFVDVAGRPPTSRPQVDELQRTQAARNDEHARALLATVKAAASTQRTTAA